MSELVLEYRDHRQVKEYPFGFKLMFLYLLNVVDWFCTQVLIDTGYFHEANPLMIWIMDYPLVGFSVKCMLPLALIIFIWMFYRIFKLEQNRFTNIAIYCGVIIYSVVMVVHIINFLLLFLGI